MTYIEQVIITAGPRGGFGVIRDQKDRGRHDS